MVRDGAVLGRWARQTHRAPFPPLPSPLLAVQVPLARRGPLLTATPLPAFPPASFSLARGRAGCHRDDGRGLLRGSRRAPGMGERRARPELDQDRAGARGLLRPRRGTGRTDHPPHSRPVGCVLCLARAGRGDEREPPNRARPPARPFGWGGGFLGCTPQTCSWRALLLCPAASAAALPPSFDSLLSTPSPALAAGFRRGPVPAHRCGAPRHRPHEQGRCGWTLSPPKDPSSPLFFFPARV